MRGFEPRGMDVEAARIGPIMMLDGPAAGRERLLPRLSKDVVGRRISAFRTDDSRPSLGSVGAAQRRPRPLGLMGDHLEPTSNQ